MPEKEKKYRVVVTEICDNSEGKIVHDEEHKGLMMVAENVSGGCMEMLININIADIAAMLAAGEKTKLAVILAHMMLKMAKAMKDDPEDVLADLIEGGIQ